MRFQPFQANQMKLVTAISDELSRQVPDLPFDSTLFNKIVEAANMICEECKRERIYATSKMTPAEWLASDDVGLSSRYMLTVLTGSNCEPNGPVPSDADDLGRCIRMVQACQLSDEITRLYTMGNQWRRIAENWEMLCKQYQANKAESIYTFLNFK